MSEKKIEKVVPIRKGESNEAVVASLRVPRRQVSPLVATIRRTCAWVVMITSILFAFTAILSIWIDAGEIAGRAWATFLIISVVSGFIALISSLLDNTNK